MSPFVYIALVLLLAVYVHGQEEESYELPHAKLFAYKSIKAEQVVVNTDLVIFYQLLNTGKLSAFNVEVEDAYSSSKFHLLHNVDSQGKVHVAFDEIPPGGSKSFNVTIKPLQAGFHHSTGATVRYNYGGATASTETDGIEITEEEEDDGITRMVGRSNSLGKIQILNHATVNSKSFISNGTEWLVFFGCYSLALILPYLSMNSHYSKLTSFKMKEELIPNPEDSTIVPSLSLTDIRGDTMSSITVTNPSKITEKGRSYVMYTVSSGNDCVYRRYSDFTWLNKEISRQFPQENMPHLPEKQTLGRFDINFLETRRKQLERYLCQLADRNTIFSSEIMTSFLTLDEFDFNSIKNKSQSQYTTSILGSITNSVTSTSDTTRSSYWLYEGSKTHKTDNIEKTNADMKIEEIQSYIIQAERHISAVVKEGENMVNCNRLIATALYNNSHSFSYLGYGDGDTLGAAFNQLGSMSSVLSDLTTEYAESEQAHFMAPLQVHLQSIVSIKSLIVSRNERKSRYISSLLDLESKVLACRKLDGIQGKESQLNSKQLLVERATVTLENNKNEYKKVTHQLLQEYMEYKREKDAAVKKIIMSFLRTQQDYYQRCHAVWAAASPLIKEMNNIVPSVAASRTSNIFDDIDEEELFSV